MRPWLSRGRTSRLRGERQAWLAGVATNLKPGDALLFVGDEFFASSTQRRLGLSPRSTAVEPDAANDRTRVAWARGLGASAPFSNPPAQPQCVRAAQARGRVRPQRAGVAQHGPRVPQRLRGQVRRFHRRRRMAQLHHHAAYPERHGRRRSISTGPVRDRGRCSERHHASQPRRPGQGRLQSAGRRLSARHLRRALPGDRHHRGVARRVRACPAR